MCWRDEDTGLSEQARLVVLAALGAPDDLAEVLGEGATSPELVESLNAADDGAAQPVGAYLRSMLIGVLDHSRPPEVPPGRRCI
jgi:hypothetical protein